MTFRTGPAERGDDGVVMTLPCDSLTEQLALEFTLACTELADARDRRTRKDSTAHRAAVAECEARVDRILDMFLEACRGGR